MTEIPSTPEPELPEELPEELPQVDQEPGDKTGVHDRAGDTDRVV